MITEEEIHNIYLHMSGKAEGIAEATGAADFPVLFAHAVLEYTKRPWVGLTDEDVNKESAMIASQMKLAFHAGMYVAQQILKERNT
jgi:hypothetical protein